MHTSHAHTHTTRAHSDTHHTHRCINAHTICHTHTHNITTHTQIFHTYMHTNTHPQHNTPIHTHSRVTVVQSLSHVNSGTPRTAALWASLSVAISRSSLKRIDSVMPSNHLILCCPLLLLPSIFPNIWVLSNESALWIRGTNYWSFSFSISPSNEYSRLISFRMNWLDLHAVQGTLKPSPAPQFKSINSLALSLLYGPALTSKHDYWKNPTFDHVDLCWQSNVSAF